MVEYRSATRVRTVLKGEIRYDNGRMSTSCVIRDLSEDGARLELPGELALPDRFDLYIEKRNETRPAVVKRKRGVEIGVAFADAAVMPAAAGDVAERLSRL